MSIEVTYEDLNGKKVTRVFNSPGDLINKLGSEARTLSLKQKASKDPDEQVRLLRAERCLRKILSQYPVYPTVLTNKFN